MSLLEKIKEMLRGMFNKQPRLEEAVEETLETTQIVEEENVESNVEEVAPVVEENKDEDLERRMAELKSKFSEEIHRIEALKVQNDELDRMIEDKSKQLYAMLLDLEKKQELEEI